MIGLDAMIKLTIASVSINNSVIIASYMHIYIEYKTKFSFEGLGQVSR